MRTIDISNKLSNERPKIKLAEGKVYEIDNSKDTMLLVNNEFKNGNNEMEIIDIAIRKVLGENAFKEIEEMKLSVADYKTLFSAIMAGVSGETLEDAEKNLNSPR